MLAMYHSAQNVQVGGAPVLSSLHKCLHIVISQLKLVNKLGGVQLHFCTVCTFDQYPGRLEQKCSWTPPLS